MIPDTGRARRNPQKIRNGRSSILSDLNSVASRCNKLMKTNLEVPSVDFMDCDADVYEGSDDPSESGSYTSGNSTHAEMNALASYIRGETDFETISKITITAPPCKSCAFVLELLGIIGKVKTTKAIYKNATGSWSFPDDLKDTRLFDPGRWQTIRGYFKDSGLSDQEILDEMVAVIQSRSAL
ncbi:MAG: hypothetical protein LUM44_01380 [Pyrinomonadaceae bacterium]|nr:hypothetical protein [Pyrinomonadaceae bacterium]